MAQRTWGMRLRKRRGIDVKTYNAGAYVRDRCGYTTSPRSWASNTTYCLVGAAGTLGPQMALLRVIFGVALTEPRTWFEAARTRGTGPPVVTGGPA
jgi:hypothetical protein